MKELKLIEGRNTGFPNAKEALLRNGSSELKIEMNPDRDYLTVIIPIHSYFAPKKIEADQYAEKILDILDEHLMTMTELAKAMGYKGITAKQRRYVKDLIDANKLEHVFSDGKVKLKVK